MLYSNQSLVQVVGLTLGLIGTLTACGDDDGTPAPVRQEKDSGTEPIRPQSTASSRTTSSTLASTQVAISTAKTAQSASPSASARPGPEGCYVEANHVCDCDVNRTQCETDGNIWTSGCNSCAASTTESKDAGSDSGTAIEDAGASSNTVTTTQPTATVSAGPAGCYLPTQHRCDCAVTQNDCTAVSGTWTDGCKSCANPASSASGSASASASASTTLSPGVTATSSQSATAAATTTASATASASAGPQNWGCYNPSSHVCDCSTLETACISPLIWTSGCNSCSH